MSNIGIFAVFATKIRLAPIIPVQLEMAIPAAPALSKASESVVLSYPMFFTNSLKSFAAVSFSVFNFSYSSGVANSLICSSLRPIFCYCAINTIFPFTEGSHASKAPLADTLGKVITSAFTAFLVAGLQANWVATNVFTRG